MQKKEQYADRSARRYENVTNDYGRKPSEPGRGPKTPKVRVRVLIVLQRWL